MGKKKLQRFAEMEVLPNVFQPKHEEIFRTDYKNKGRWRSDVFHNDNPIVLEIGCGKGEYTVELAKLYPDRNFIGMDIKGSRMWNGAKKACDEGIQNVAFIRMYAEMLEGAFALGEVDEIWLTFPDPQMSKARKRLSGSRFLSLYQKICNHCAIMNLKTDSDFLYNYTDALVKQNGFKELVNYSDLYGSDYKDKILSIKTFYERQWLSRGKTIKYLRFELPANKEIIEPDIELEKDDYNSKAKYMVN